MSGIPIDNRGDLGPGMNESDRVDIGFLPDDIDQNGIVQPLDLLRFRQLLTGVLGTTDRGSDRLRGYRSERIDLAA